MNRIILRIRKIVELLESAISSTSYERNNILEDKLIKARTLMDILLEDIKRLDK